MRPPVHMKFVDKAQAALIAAVEIYNKPSFSYREETFAILAINAWELLLKAKVLKDNDNDQKSITLYEQRQTRSGVKSKKRYLQRSRSGNPKTLSLGACILALDAKESSRLSPAIKGNLDALTEIRDNAVHYINASDLLSKQVLEVGAATVKNFVLAGKSWFKRDFSNSISLILPLAFLESGSNIETVTVSPDESNLINYLKQIANDDTTGGDEFKVALRVTVKFERSKLDNASKVVISNDEDAVKVTLSEEDVRAKYPWDYNELVSRLENRYTDFKRNKKFYDICRVLKKNNKFVKQRFLDPDNSKSPKKEYYNSNIIPEFDKHYTRRNST